MTIEQPRRRSMVNRTIQTIADRIVIRSAVTFCKDRVKQAWGPLGALTSRRRVSVLSYSDVELDISRQYTWGDYWFKFELTRAIGRMGFAVVNPLYRPDVIVHLFGQPVDLARYRGAHKVLWIHSNPDRITHRALAQYDRICCISETFAEKVRSMGFPCEVVQLGTSKQPMPSLPKLYDVVFVGNALLELGGRRPIVDDIGHPDYDFKVWGRGYRSLPERYFGGEYYDNCTLGLLYASSCISLNDHRPAMASEGFLNPRIFDVLAAGGFCISDSNPAIAALFGDAVPQYTSPAHLRELLAHFLSHSEEREALASQGQAVVLQYTWARVASALLEGISPHYDA